MLMQFSCISWPYYSVLHIPLLFYNELFLGPSDHMTYGFARTQFMINSYGYILSLSWLNGPSFPGPGSMPELFFKRHIILHGNWQAMLQYLQKPKWWLSHWELNRNYTWYLFQPMITLNTLRSAELYGQRAGLLALQPGPAGESFPALGLT